MSLSLSFAFVGVKCAYDGNFWVYQKVVWLVIEGDGITGNILKGNGCIILNELDL